MPLSPIIAVFGVQTSSNPGRMLIKAGEMWWQEPRIFTDPTDQCGLSVAIRRIRENPRLQLLQSYLCRFRPVLSIPSPRGRNETVRDVATQPESPTIQPCEVPDD